MSTQQLVYVTYIKTTAEKLWATLADPAFGGHSVFGRCVEPAWQTGAELRCMTKQGESTACGLVLESDPPRRLSISWRPSPLPDGTPLPETIVSYDIEARGEVVKLTVIESYPEVVSEDYLEGGSEGWAIILSGLKTLLETGQPLPRFGQGATG